MPSFIGSVTTKNVGRNRNDIMIHDIRPLVAILPPSHISLLCIGPHITEVRQETPQGVLIIAAPPYDVWDNGHTFTTPRPQPMLSVAFIFPHIHHLIDWTHHYTIMVHPGFEFVYISPNTGQTLRSPTINIVTQIQGSVSIG
jgi:hypothetical protein